MKRITLQTPRRARGSVCQLCQFSRSSPPRHRTLHTPSLSVSPRLNTSLPSTEFQRRRYIPTFNAQICIATRYASNIPNPRTSGDPEAMLDDVLKEFDQITSSPRVPSDEAVIQFLQSCSEVVKVILSRDSENQVTPPQTARSDNSPTSSLLDLDVDEGANGAKSTSQKGAPKNPKTPQRTYTQATAANQISSMLNDFLRDPKIFISPDVLRRYTLLQAQLKQADNFPEIFSLYATKPIPEGKGSTVTYHASNPTAVKSAIPQDIANVALDTAIEKKNLALCLAIIDESFCKPAYFRSKIFRKAALPLSGLATAPVASYAAASYISTLQTAMDPSTALWGSFSAILAYIAFTSSIGMVAITTANDQMIRVVWLPGMPLRERWLREEERAAMDKVAVAWGFKDPRRRGEEEGEEWESLREFIGMRGMILDKTDLMEGME
ncbi:hypothetical protein AJ79_01339 [Helicocarpus griseus UAMH5409]|uniref:Uncharacterized protein n=1 Tax=Helicocarpus griseus UAMH5409 TaxID=1447875 RepID=A0A2B7Y821_9EURO|nr:hypothetical protein AJ79_01339 [Helicocarpus griseus UAMH5409]